jgi:hypothetical protein
MNELMQYRIIQESPDHLVVQLVVRGELDPGLLVQLRARFLERLGEPVKVGFQCMDVIRDDAPKFRSFVSKLSVGDS